MKKQSILRKHLMLEMIGKYKIVKKDHGTGTFGKVMLVTRPGNEEELFALKKINLLDCGEKDKQHCRAEVEQLRHSNHENIVKYIDSFQQDNNLCIVMEYCKGGNLRQYILGRPKVLEEAEFLKLMEQICKGLKYLHDRNIAHRDVKTTNILLTEENQIKIADLGLAKLMENVTSLTKGVGSPYFMSPEMLAGKEYTTKTDIWSLGCCMYEMGTKTCLFGTASNVGALIQQVHETEKIPLLAENLPFSRRIKKLFCDMLQKDNLDKRPSIDNVLAEVTECQSTTYERKREKRTKRGQADFSKSLPEGLLRRQLEDSGIDTEASETHEKTEEIRTYKVSIEVTMNQEQKEYFDNVKNLEKLLLEKMGGNKGWMNAINNKISETRNEKTEELFLNDVKKILNSDLFEKCKLHLKSLWIYRTELLKTCFYMA